MVTVRLTRPVYGVRGTGYNVSYQVPGTTDTMYQSVSSIRTYTYLPGTVLRASSELNNVRFHARLLGPTVRCPQSVPFYVLLPPLLVLILSYYSRTRIYDDDDDERQHINTSHITHQARFILEFSERNKMSLHFFARSVYYW